MADFKPEFNPSGQAVPPAAGGRGALSSSPERPPAAPTKHAPRRRIDIAELRRLAETGLTAGEIAARIGCTRDSLYRPTKRHGIALRHDRRSAQVRGAFWRANDPELRWLVENRATAVAAARALGTTRNAVIGRAYRLGLLWHGSPAYVPPPRQTVEFPAPGQCLWPEDGIPRRWCGARAEPGRSYCPEHQRRASRPARSDIDRLAMLRPAPDGANANREQLNYSGNHAEFLGA